MVDEILKVEPQIFGSEVQHTPIARKMELWQTIVNRVNAVGHHPRTRDDIHKRWNDLWGKVRAMASRHHIAVQKTGGGSPPTPPDYTDWEEKVLATLHPEGLTGLTGGMDLGTTTHSTLMEGTRSATALQGDRGTSQNTGEGSLDTDEQAGPSHSPGCSPCSSPTQENIVTPNTQSRPAGQGRRTHTSGPRAHTPNMQEDEGPSTSGMSRPVLGTQAHGARARSSAPVGQGAGHRIDAAAQDVIAEVLGAYQHTQDRLAQIVSTLEQSQRMQLEQHQQAIEQWKEHNATMATIAGALLQLVNKQSDTHTGQEAPTTALDNQQQMTQAAETAQEIPSQESQGPTMPPQEAPQQVPKRSLRPRYGTGTQLRISPTPTIDNATTAKQPSHPLTNYT
ncbi:hypothetical protein NDU88_001121 [Pleurodeles waltl]|uniref:Myb/SANT-like DNA-binding domain-containing protein n=1 Tax=Pleurodeles waltl TaxID=8319 RepID=A0AAV7LC63_PLEWA|nr:hypothetical protein NDU88_001121 [Pleurodeles waltl]